MHHLCPISPLGHICTALSRERGPVSLQPSSWKDLGARAATLQVTRGVWYSLRISQGNFGHIGIKNLPLPSTAKDVWKCPLFLFWYSKGGCKEDGASLLTRNSVEKTRADGYKLYVGRLTGHKKEISPDENNQPLE